MVVFGGSFNFAHTYLPAGKYTVPWIFPAASSALCIAAVSDVFPSPFAPKSRTLKTLFFDGQSEPSAAAGVQVGGRFVQNQDLGPSVQGSGQGNFLPLAAGQPAGVFSGVGHYSSGQGIYGPGKSCEGTCGCHGPDIIAAVAHCDVVKNGPVENVRLLGHYGDVFPPPFRMDVPQIHSSNRDPALGGGVSLHEHGGNGTLSAAVAAPDEIDPPWQDVEGESVQELHSARERESYPAGLDTVVRSRGEVNVIPGVLCVQVQNIEDPLGADAGFGDLPVAFNEHDYGGSKKSAE